MDEKDLFCTSCWQKMAFSKHADVPNEVVFGVIERYLASILEPETVEPKITIASNCKTNMEINYS